jgi:MFS transporter, PAT family, beta-lactamase induction signal transducer AmpG
MWCWLLILLLDSASSSIANTMFRPLLVDIGLSLADIGWLIGTVNYGCLMIGGLIGGLLISTLGRKWSLFLFSLLSIFASLIYLLPSFGWKSLPVLYFVAISTGLVGGLMATTTFTIMMDKSGEDTPGTDYTVQSSFGVLGSIGAAAISGKLAETIGYRGVFGLGIVFAVVCFLLINILPALSRSSSEHQN